MRGAVLLGLLALGCEGKSAKESASSRPIEGACDYVATGTWAGRGHSQGGIDMVGSDYWTPDLGPGLLVIRCAGPLTFAFATDPSVTREAFPMAPGTYPISATTASKIVVLAHDDKNHAFSAERGALELTRFDETGVVGTFALDLADMSGKTATVNVHVTGSFDLPRPKI